MPAVDPGERGSNAGSSVVTQPTPVWQARCKQNIAAGVADDAKAPTHNDKATFLIEIKA
jgi:hypothetical protein